MVWTFVWIPCYWKSSSECTLRISIILLLLRLDVQLAVRSLAMASSEGGVVNVIPKFAKCSWDWPVPPSKIWSGIDEAMQMQWCCFHHHHHHHHHHHPFQSLSINIYYPFPIEKMWLCLPWHQERRMVLLGVDNAGKTTTLEQLKTLFGLKAMAPDRPVRGWFLFQIAPKGKCKDSRLFFFTIFTEKKKKLFVFG